MPRFAYRAREKNGSLSQGVIEAENINVAKEKIASEGLIPVQVKPQGLLNLKIDFKFGKKVAAEELVLFTKQFGTLFKAGMGIESILATLAKQTDNAYLKQVLFTIQEDIQSGSSLTNAFKRHPKVFDDLYVNMLTSGEEAGILDEVLDHLATLLEKDQVIRKNIKSALMYPKIVVGVLVFANIIILTFVVPKFINLFAAFGAGKLPLPTRILIQVSEIFQSYFFFVVLGFVGLFFLFKKYASTPKGRFRIDKILLKLPIFGTLLEKVGNARFANILASLYRSGLPITKGLEITAATLGNHAFMREVKLLQADVEKGSGIADSMRKLKYFSPIIIEATNIGEKTGSLDNMLKSISEHYDMEVDHMVKNLTTLIEPMMLVLLFGMVGLFALAVFMPMFNLMSSMM